MSYQEHWMTYTLPVHEHDFIDDKISSRFSGTDCVFVVSCKRVDDDTDAEWETAYVYVNMRENIGGWGFHCPKFSLRGKSLREFLGWSCEYHQGFLDGVRYTSKIESERSKKYGDHSGLREIIERGSTAPNISKPCVYFYGQQNFVKIGYSSNGPHSRLSAVNTGNPCELELVTYLSFDTAADAKRAESEIHSAFHEVRSSGEWFFLGHRLRYFISLVKDNLSDRSSNPCGVFTPSDRQLAY